MKIRTNDEVVVLRGKDRGKRGRVLSVIPKHGKVVVEGVNIITKHLRRNPQNPQAGGRVQRPAPIAASSVAIWSEAEGRGVRVRMSTVDGKKSRVSTKTGKPVGAASGKGN
jgi:large subunit ribosomal protein L24